MAGYVKNTPDVSKPLERNKAYIIGPRLAASAYEVIFICGPAGCFLIPSAVCLFLFGMIVDILFLSLISLGEYFIPFEQLGNR